MYLRNTKMHSEFWCRGPENSHQSTKNRDFFVPGTKISTCAVKTKILIILLFRNMSYLPCFTTSLWQKQKSSFEKQYNYFRMLNTIFFVCEPPKLLYCFSKLDFFWVFTLCGIDKKLWIEITLSHSKIPSVSYTQIHTTPTQNDEIRSDSLLITTLWSTNHTTPVNTTYCFSGGSYFSNLD